MKRDAATQTDFTMENSVICYTTIILAYTKKSPSPRPEDTITMAPFEREPRFNAATLSESSDEDNDINYEICTRKPTRPMALDVKAKRDKFGCYMGVKSYQATI
jgi:hypothetical protein